MAEKTDDFEELYQDLFGGSKEKKPDYINHRERVKRSMALDVDWSSKNDHEILEYVLFCTIKRKDTKPIAHELINTFGSLAAVARASIGELMQIDGIGESSARMIAAMVPFSRRAEQSRQRGQVYLSTPVDAARLLLPLFMSLTTERIYIVSVDTNDRVIQTDLLAHGDVNTANIDIMKLIMLLGRSGASKMILAHNHPAGTLVPSLSDVDVTTRVLLAAHLVKVHFLDHIIVGANNDYFSFMSSSMMNEVYAYTDKLSYTNLLSETRVRKILGNDRYTIKEEGTEPNVSFQEQMNLLKRYRSYLLDSKDK